VINHLAAKPAIDDEAFTRLLEAAFILQEHRNSALQKASPEDFPRVVGSILEIQRQTQAQQIDCNSALELIARRLCELTGAVGATIGRLEQDKTHYLAGSGSAAILADSSISVDATSSCECVRTARPVSSPATETDRRLNLVLCRKLGAKSFLAVPVFRDGSVSGVIELFFAQQNGFGEMEIRTAELVSGVVGEVFKQEAAHKLQKGLAFERDSILSILEQLKPQLQKLAGHDLVKKQAPEPIQTQPCRACGQPLSVDESSCTSCGASRITGKYPGAELQSKWAALWERQMIDGEHAPSFRRPPVSESESDGSPEPDVRPGETLVQETMLTDDPEPPPTSLVIKARPAVETDSSEEFETETAIDQNTAAVPAPYWRRVLNSTLSRRLGDISLAVAAFVFASAVVWGVLSRPPAKPAHNRGPRPSAPQLSLFERTLVSLGLAVPPPTPEYLGNPNVKVWVDLQTGLYYCPGASLYGSTSKGRYSSQSDAQQDQFEPAARTPCD